MPCNIIIIIITVLALSGFIIRIKATHFESMAPTNDKKAKLKA